MSALKEIEVHIFGGSQELYEKIFPKAGEQIEKDFGILQKRINKKDMFEKLLFFKKDLDVVWAGYKYPDLIDSNYKSVLFKSFQLIKNSPNKKIIILKFGNSFLKEFKMLINRIDTDFPCALFVFSEEDEIPENYFESFKKPQYIGYLKDKKDPEDPNKMYNKIISYLWEKDCYYNESGNVSCQYSPANLLYKPPKGFLFYNILLTGESRAGKSSFINRTFNKLTTYETAKLESETKEITYYEFFHPDSNEDNSEKKLIKNGFGGIRIIDTPGLVKTKNLNSFQLIKKKLDEEFKQMHLVYFFLKSQSNIENCIDMLEYIKNKNEERKKKNKNKIPIIFVKNGEDLQKGGNGTAFFQQLKNELKKHNLFELFDDYINKIEEKKLNEEDFFNEEETEKGDYDKYIEGNIIQVHIPSGKNMNIIFSTTKEYILKYNDLLIGDKLKDEFNKMGNNASQLTKFYIKEKLQNKSLTKEEGELYKKLYKESNEFTKMLKKNCSILYSLDMLNVKKFSEFIASSVVGTIFGSIMGGLAYATFGISLIVYIGLYITMQVIVIRRNFIGNIAIKYGFGEQDIINYGLEEYVYGSEKSNEKFDEKSERKVKRLFAFLIFYMGPIQCALKSKESMDQILEIIENLIGKKEEDWNNFKVEKI